MSTPPREPAAEVDEAALLAGLRRGEEAAFERLVRQLGGRLLAVARRFLRDEAEAEDAVQEAFLQAFRNIERFEGTSRLSTWLHRIVVNAALMRLRKRARTPETSLDELLPRFQEDGHQLDPADPWAPTGDELLERAELQQLVRDSIDRLPDDYRNVLLLRDIEELDTRQTAEALGISTNATKTRLHRARQALRTLLDGHLRETRP